VDASLILLLIVGATLYFLPTLAAIGGDRLGPVFVIDLFFGWTLVGWAVALAIAVSSKAARRVMTCPMCAEDVLSEAIICKHCRHRFAELGSGS
jgi:hypothetical protein